MATNSNLYLIEILVENIEFTPSATEVPKKTDLSVTATVGNFLTLTVQSVLELSEDVEDAAEDEAEDIPEDVPEGGAEEGEEPPPKPPTIIKFNSGKSCLFLSTSNELNENLTNYPLNINLFKMSSFTALATTNIAWTQECLDFVQLSATVDNMKPCCVKNKYQLNNIDSEVIATVKLYTRLSHFGKTIQTQFHFLEYKDLKETEKKCLIRCANATTTIQCERCCEGAVSEGLPVGPLYNMFELLTESSEEAEDTEETEKDNKISTIPWFKLFDCDTTPEPSDPPFVLKSITHNFINIFKDSTTTMDIVSIIERPEEREYFDLMIKATSAGFFVNLQEGENYQELVTTKQELTNDIVNKLLCKNKHCPAARKFKDLGLGPLATGKCLGTLYTNVSAPVEYGLSNTYGVLENYGPYGVLSNSREKREKKRACEKGCCGPLRLTGGSPLESDNGIQQKSPLFECKEVMDELDKILEEYRSALGPCGNVTCPYAPNLMRDNCQKVCINTDMPPSMPPAMPPGMCYNDDITSCVSVQCPFAGQLLAAQTGQTGNRSACGSPTCAYAKYKTGLTDDDALMELQYLPPALSGKCGSPKCKYPVKQDLPPIHWDCPDPLPKGPCKNPDCPFLPAELRSLKVLQPKGPCGSPTCPYAMPSPCANPCCPFNQPPKKDDDDMCDNPDCPFKQKEEDDMCDNPDCPYKEKEDDDMCDNPNCPYKEKKDDDVCDNPCCPFKQPPKKDDICKNPNCPLSGMENGSGERMSNEICNDPSCPYAVLNKSACVKKPSPCSGPDDNCPFTKENLKGLHALFQKLQSWCENNPLQCQEETVNKGERVSRSERMSKIEMEPSDDRPPLGTKRYRPSLIEDVDDGRMEISSGTRISMDAPFPCIPAKCKTDNTCKECGGNDPPSDMPCTTLTCQADDGTNKCGICGVKVPGQSKSQTEPRVLTCEENGKGKGKRKSKSEPGLTTKQKKKGKLSKKFIYSMGDKYPGVQIGHKECTMPGFRIPKTMGWLWNIHVPCLTLKPRRGWRPGAIGRTIAERIRKHRQKQGIAMLTLPAFPKKGKKRKGAGSYASSSDMSVPPKPTLLIKKRDGAYFITMNPLKDPKTLEDNENPYMDCTPIQFKITKNKKKGEDEPAYKICRCEGEDAPEETCDESPGSSSSESELDIEFTPPAGIIHPERLKKKKHVVHCDTQYDVKDFKPPKGKGKKGGKGGKKGKGKKGKKK